MTDRIVTVIQGRFETGSAQDVVLSTVLGSCVAVCLFDPLARIGGMNHYLLARSPDGGAGDMRFGVHANELLLNALFKLGAGRGRLRAKIFGGAHLGLSGGGIGDANANLAMRYLADEGIPVIARSTGGTQARRIHFRPVTGHVKQLLVPADAAAIAPPPPPKAALIELFD